MDAKKNHGDRMKLMSGRGQGRNHPDVDASDDKASSRRVGGAQHAGRRPHYPPPETSVSVCRPILRRTLQWRVGGHFKLNEGMNGETMAGWTEEKKRQEQLENSNGWKRGTGRRNETKGKSTKQQETERVQIKNKKRLRSDGLSFNYQ